MDQQITELSGDQLIKRKKFELLYEQQQREREDLKIKKNDRDLNINDPQELMLYIQKEFRSQYDGKQRILFRAIKIKLDSKLILTTEDIDESLFQFKELQVYYVNKSYSLTSFDKQQYKEALDLLECSLYNIRSIIIPRKQFKFSKPFEKYENNESIKEITQQTESSIDQRIISPEIPYQDEEFNGGSLVVRNLKNLDLILKGTLDTVYLQNLESVDIDLSDIKGSVWADKCLNCKFIGKMHQLRIHETHGTTFIVFVTSKPIIERCTNLSFGQFKQGSLCIEEKQNFWSDVQDFNWLKQEKSPNFKLID